MSFMRGALPPLAHALPTARTAFVHPIAIPKPPSSAASRLFTSSARSHHFSTPPPSGPKPSSSSSSKSSPFAFARNAFRGDGKRSVYTAPPTAYGGSARPGVDWRKVGINVGLGVVGAVGLNFALNRETRGPLSGFEGEYLNSTFRWTAGGLAITAAVAFAAHRNGLAFRLMSANPWLVMGGGLILSIGSMMAVYATPPDSPLHYLGWATFSAMQGVTLSPLFFLNPAILTRAGLYTLGATAGISYVGATAKSDQYLWIGGPLLAGLGVLICTSLAPMIMPRMAMRTLTTLESVGAYGGVAVFSGFILYDTQKILKHAQMAQRGVLPADPIRESVSLILDVINLFTSIVRVLLLQQNRRK
ncbi:hypothetical protein JCM5296_001391 [Sporobolomyces johnsonii]